MVSSKIISHNSSPCITDPEVLTGNDLPNKFWILSQTQNFWIIVETIPSIHKMPKKGSKKEYVFKIGKLHKL